MYTSSPGCGWFPLQRKIANRPDYKRLTPNEKLVFLSLLLLTQPSDGDVNLKGKLIQANKHEIITSRNELSAHTGLSPNIVKNCLSRLLQIGWIQHEAIRNGMYNLGSRIILADWISEPDDQHKRPTAEPYISSVSESSVTNGIDQQTASLLTNGIDQQQSLILQGVCPPSRPTEMTSLMTNNKYNKRISKEDIYTSFENCWSIYPVKQGKKAAAKAFESFAQEHIKAGEGLVDITEKVCSGIRNYNSHIDKNHIEQKFIKHGDTFFRGRCWEDEYTPSPTRKLTREEIAKEIEPYFKTKEGLYTSESLRDLEYLLEKKVTTDQLKRLANKANSQEHPINNFSDLKAYWQKQ